MATDNERMFREKLSILNENFLRFLQKAHRSNSSLDFTPSIKDYLKHLRGLDQMYYVDETTDASAVTNAPLTAATTTAANIPLLFGTNATPKTTTTPTTAVFPSFSTLNEGVSLTSTSSTVTTTASTTETSAVPKLIVGATAPVTTTSPSSTLTFGGFGATAPVTTTSPSSTLTFGGVSTTTTTTAANIPLLFGITATPKTTTTTTAAFPSFSTFSAGNFPISSITGSLFGSSTTQTVTSTSSGQLQVNGGSRKRSAAQSVDEISPYGKRAAPTLTTETSVKCPFGTTASMTSTSASSAFTFGGVSTTTTTTAANIPLLFGITATPKTTTTTTAAFPSFSTFSPGNFQTSSITGSLFGGSAINTATTTTISLTSTSSTVTTTASTTETSAVPKPIVGATVPVTTTNSSSTFSFGGFGATAQVTTTSPSSTFSFGGFGATAPVTTTSSSSTFSFGGSPTTTTTTAANIPLLFKSTATTAAFPSFSTFGAGIFPTSSITGSLFGGSAINTANSSPVVGSTEKEAPEKGNGSDDEPTEEFVPTDNFKPIVPLPPKVETKSGEENEEMLFSARCKLFRYKDKQSKERGIGELKLLHNKESGRYRCVIRSGDQLSKLFANFPVLANMKSQATQQKPNIRTLKCKDFSDNSDGVDEVFLLKFRDQTTAEEFAAKLEETVTKLEKSKGTD